MNMKTYARSPGKAKRAFTLVELLVVIAIIGILIALLLPAVQAAREAARRSQCTNNLKQLALALHNYHDTYQCFPPGGWSSRNQLGWTVHILPYIEQQPLYDQFNQSAGTGYGANNGPTVNRVDAFLCPSGRKIYGSETVGTQQTYATHYYGVMGPQGINPVTSAVYGGPNDNVSAGSNHHGGFANQGILYANSWIRMAEILDGTSNTFIVGEISWEDANCYRAWHRGVSSYTSSTGQGASGTAKNIEYGINLIRYNGSNNFNDVSMGSMHPGGTHFGIADGSVRFISETVDMTLYLSAASRNGKEPKTAIE